MFERKPLSISDFEMAMRPVGPQKLSRDESLISFQSHV